jgi:hypothetical protein
MNFTVEDLCGLLVGLPNDTPVQLSISNGGIAFLGEVSTTRDGSVLLSGMSA